MCLELHLKQGLLDTQHTVITNMEIMISMVLIMEGNTDICWDLMDIMDMDMQRNILLSMVIIMKVLMVTQIISITITDMLLLLMQQLIMDMDMFLMLLHTLLQLFKSLPLVLMLVSCISEKRCQEINQCPDLTERNHYNHDKESNLHSLPCFLILSTFISDRFVQYSLSFVLLTAKEILSFPSPVCPV